MALDILSEVDGDLRRDGESIGLHAALRDIAALVPAISVEVGVAAIGVGGILEVERERDTADLVSDVTAYIEAVSGF